MNLFINNDITCIHGNNSRIYITSNTKIYNINIDTSIRHNFFDYSIIINDYFNNDSIVNTIYNNNNNIYKSIYSLDDNNVVAVGDNIISYTYNGLQNSQSIWNNVILNNTYLNSVYIYDISNAIAVGNNGVILVTNDCYKTWYNPVDLFNSSGNYNILYDSSNKFTSIAL